MQQNLYGALGAGGTKMICGIVDGTGKIIDQKSFPTTTPKDTFPPLLEYFKEHKTVALGIGSFGPVDVLAQLPMEIFLILLKKDGKTSPFFKLWLIRGSN